MKERERPLRVVVLSSTHFGLRCINDGVLATPEARLVGILTTPRVIPISYAPNGLTINTHTDFRETAASTGCEVAELTHSPRIADYLQHLEPWRADLILVLGWYYNVPRTVRETASQGCLGIHASLLPRYRGGAPLVWAIMNGEQETGVSLFHLTDEIDAGDIVGQRAFKIEDADTIATVLKKSESSAVSLLAEKLPLLVRGQAECRCQDHTQATVFPQRSPGDGLIDWSWSRKKLYDFIRAQTHPYPGAYFYQGNEKTYLWDASTAMALYAPQSA